MDYELERKAAGCGVMPTEEEREQQCVVTLSTEEMAPEPWSVTCSESDRIPGFVWESSGNEDDCDGGKNDYNRDEQNVAQENGYGYRCGDGKRAKKIDGFESSVP